MSVTSAIFPPELTILWCGDEGVQFEWKSTLISDSHLEPRHDAGGEKLEGPERLTLVDAAEVDLHRRLMLADEIAVELYLLNHFFGRSHQRGMTVDHFLRRECTDGVYKFVVTSVLARLLPGPRAHCLGENFNVSVYRPFESF